MRSAPPDEQATFIRHSNCDKCGSSDALGVYDDHTWCFSCETYTKTDEPGGATDGAGSETVSDTDTAKQEGLLSGIPKAIPARGLTEETCRKFGYLIGKHNGQEVQIATYRDANGKPVAQKVRTRDKKFSVVGNGKDMTLWGSHLWSKGKKLVIAEGEIDCMVISQIQGNRWPTVSLSGGAPSAVKTIKRNWDYINNFDEIVLMFDMDQVGQKAALEVAEMLPVGKAKIAHLPCKDAADCLAQDKAGDIITAIFQARDFRPDGIKPAQDFRDAISIDETASAISWPYSQLDSILMGLRKRELICLAAGSGTGKTTFTKELIHHLLMSDQKVGVISLEEAPKRTLLGLVGIHLNKNLLIDRSQADDDTVTEAFDDLFNERTCVLYDSWGTNEISVICQRIRYMAKALDIDFVILDHVSILVSGAEGDERRMLDQAATAFRTIVQELNIGMIMVSHLTRPGGRGHESGAAVELSQLRGSHALAQLSDAAIGIQKDPDDPDSDVRLLRVLKNRYSGQIGDAGTLVYNRETGRLLEEELAMLADNDNSAEEGEIHATASHD